MGLRLVAIFLLLFTPGMIFSALAGDVTAPEAEVTAGKIASPTPIYYYTYKDRDHSLRESVGYLGALYVINWGSYFISMKDTVKEEGSFDNYRHNFGHLVLDKDNPFWNWGVHPYTGSQVYLFYRANGYSRLSAFSMTFLQDMLFECFIENYSEPISIQDLYQTSVLGSILGYGLEHLSLYLLNSGWTAAKVVGHILNPSTLFWFYEGKVQIQPSIMPTIDRSTDGGRIKFAPRVALSWSF